MRWIWLLLCLALPSHAAQITFAWDAQPVYPAGVTYELQANGVTATGITGTSYTLTIPDGPGQSLTAQVRATAAGYTDSAWTTFSGYVPGATVPNAVVNLRAANTQTGGGGIMAAPTFSATTQSNSPADLATADASTTRTTPSYSPASGTILVGCGFSEDTGLKPISSISGGPTWTQQYLDNTASKASTALYTATAAGGSITSTVTSSSSFSKKMGLAVLQFTGSDGIGAKNTANGTTGFPSVGLTTTQDNSAVVMLVTDWNATTGTSTFSTVNTTPVEVVDYADGTNYGVHIAYWSDVGAAGAKTFAMSAPSGQSWIAQVIEVKGTAGGAPTFQQVVRTLMGVGR